jgi:hypothetical protein
MKRTIFVKDFLLFSLLMLFAPFLLGAIIHGSGSGGVAVEADTLQTVTDRGNVSTGNDESNPLEILGTGAHIANGWRIGMGTDGKPFFLPICDGVENDCDREITIASGKTYRLKDSGGNTDFEYTESTGKITVATIDATVANVALTLYDERHFSVATCQNTTAAATFDLATTNTPAPTCNTGSNTQKAYLAFDATTDESFEDHWILPTGFVSVNVHFRWKAAATSGAVGWCAQLIRVADGSTSDPAYPAQASGNCVSDTAKGTTLQENAASITSVTCTSCVAGDHVYVRISRDANGGAVTDDMTGDALLLNYGRVFVVTQ